FAHPTIYDVGLSHVAALRIVEHGVAQRDPGIGRKEADRDRLLALQRHDERLPVLTHVAAHEGHVLDFEAAPDQALERLLLLRKRRRYDTDERSGDCQ